MEFVVEKERSSQHFVRNLEYEQVCGWLFCNIIKGADYYRVYRTVADFIEDNNFVTRRVFEDWINSFLLRDDAIRFGFRRKELESDRETCFLRICKGLGINYPSREASTLLHLLITMPSEPWTLENFQKWMKLAKDKEVNITEEDIERSL